MKSLYLASESPRRQTILQQLGVDFELLPPQPSEDPELLEIAYPNEPAQQYVQRVTFNKLQAAKTRLMNQNKIWAPILCADTCVCIKTQTSDILLGKPQNLHEAKKMLNQLNGQAHWVHTAVAIATSLQDPGILRLSSSEVFFGENSDLHIERYLATNEPIGKAGAYGIQGLGSALIERIHGSYSGIMGLPIYETIQLLDLAKIRYMLSP